MAIFNLTREKYSSLVTKDFIETLYDCLDVQTHHNLLFRLLRLQKTPVYLVDTVQSELIVPVPDSQYAVYVPKDRWEEMSEVSSGKSLNDILRLWDLREYSKSDKKPEPNNGIRRVIVVDCLGVYMSDNDPIVPQRIFVWVDKICQRANGNIENASALLMQVILHELSHAYMDVARSDNPHNMLFTYDHPAYMFIEEAIANGLSLHMCMPILTANQQLFLEQFVLNQGLGYSEGVPIFKSYPIHYVTHIGVEWRWAKSFFNNDIAGVIYNALFDVIPNTGSWLRSLGYGLRHVHEDIRAQRNNTVTQTNTP